MYNDRIRVMSDNYAYLKTWLHQEAIKMSSVWKYGDGRFGVVDIPEKLTDSSIRKDKRIGKK